MYYDRWVYSWSALGRWAARHVDAVNYGRQEVNLVAGWSF